ncbi:DUF3618 domain-containing protein [Neorhizobium petrolearium]|uniref:DUF3618 domain-containing protein n=1 Tax=Neorhizobium petrolearium TaxID=515361 RepID=UPI003F5CDD82
MMAHTSEYRTSSEIEREIEQDRLRIEEKITAIQQRMSPGQMLDEALSYVKSSGGAEYFTNLGHSLKTNPIPVALMGISLAWLMANPGDRGSSHDEESYPLATVDGGVRRIGPAEADGEHRYSHFVDSAGKSFKALTDETGRRAGHFLDEGGKAYRGFADATGRQIHDIRDEAGRVFEETSGWTAKAWRQVGSATRSVGRSATGAATQTWDRAGRLNEGLVERFRDQPLIGGALAFAVGAAIGAALPSTRAEDEIMGDASDEARERLSEQASRTLDKAENAASDVYSKAASVASDVHDVGRQRIAEEASALQTGDGKDLSSRRPH